MEDPTTGDPLFPPSFVTIHDLREQWLQRRQPQGQKQLEAQRRPPPGRPPQRPAQEDRRKKPEQEPPRRETDVEYERVKASQWNESDSRPSPANSWAVRHNTSVKEGSAGRPAVGSNGPKPSEKSSHGECAGYGADEKAESALVKDRRKPKQEPPRGERNAELDRGKASPRNASDSRPAPANCLPVRRPTSVKEGSDGRQRIDANGLNPTSGKSSPGEYAGFGADEKAEWALVKDRRIQPSKELPRDKTNTERERMKASPLDESHSRPSPANSRRVRRNTSVKEGNGGLQATDSNGPKPLEKSSRGEYTCLGADEKAESALVAVISGVAESADHVKKEESEKKNRKTYWSNERNGKGRSNKDIVRAREMGAKPEEGEMNEPAKEVKKEKFQRASSEGHNVLPESQEVLEEPKPREGVVHTPANDADKLIQHAASESENAMPERKEVQVDIENLAANASHVRAKAEGLNTNSKVEIGGERKNLSSQYGRKNVGGFQWGRSNHRDHYCNRVIDGKRQKERKQSSDRVWVRKEDKSDGHAGESSRFGASAGEGKYIDTR